MTINEKLYPIVTRNLESDKDDCTILIFKNLSYCKKIKNRFKLNNIWAFAKMDNQNNAKLLINSKDYKHLKLSNRENRNLINQYSLL